jgi:uncharacterized protein (DUF1786 family)
VPTPNPGNDSALVELVSARVVDAALAPVAGAFVAVAGAAVAVVVSVGGGRTVTFATNRSLTETP